MGEAQGNPAGQVIPKEKKVRYLARHAAGATQAIAELTDMDRGAGVGCSGVCRRIPCVGPARASPGKPGYLSVAVLESGNGQSGGSGAQGSVHSARRSGVTPKGRDCLAAMQARLCSCSVSRETWNQPQRKHSRLALRRNEKKKSPVILWLVPRITAPTNKDITPVSNLSADLMESDF